MSYNNLSSVTINNGFQNTIIHNNMSITGGIFQDTFGNNISLNNNKVSSLRET